ncbi:Glutamyl-tRNA(Gln) amidotransferase subunit D [Methanobacterium lacus]|uniref:Glutamyl-tRNA(Gln) amidotransferase subunit D n=1 Tax=Methanobacterium lacus (strain AL-21) TaxID=877455 RepID=F0T727_METLA|nr:Glu-tRNA(Gln) amidotransferase subunit GatD [Methanobacterium lacus]ADZ10661.1 Glutamyl-tRNA(Gln) amidotransferase subunit D [Methanobacterium lacus]
MVYKGLSAEFLDSSGLSIGDLIKVEKNGTSYFGILLDRAEDPDEKHIVIKLNSGYNIGIDVNNATAELVESGDKPKIELAPLNIEKDAEKPDISIVSTGGTVASVIDYKTGAVHPAFTAEDLIRANPELLEHANINGKAIFNILSEDMKPEYWVKTARSVADEINNGADGVVIAHGTDTMHYTSAALSFMLKTPVPVVVTGAQRSSDRPSSDAYMNLISSVVAAKSDIAEVSLCMHAEEDDSFCYLHRGTKVRKMHTTRRDTFRSINSLPLAKIQKSKLKLVDKAMVYNKRSTESLIIEDEIEEKVAFIKSYPGIQAELIDYHIDKGYKGMVLEGTGLGHCPEELIPSLERAADESIPVIMTSQCLYGLVNMNVYSTGRRILSAGVISGLDMLPETAFVKLAWALGQTDNIKEVEKIIHTNVAGELGEKSSEKFFLN